MKKIEFHSTMFQQSGKEFSTTKAKICLLSSLLNCNELSAQSICFWAVVQWVFGQVDRCWLVFLIFPCFHCHANHLLARTNMRV